MLTAEVFDKSKICKGDEGLWFYSNGLEIQAELLGSPTPLIPENTQVCLIDFTPFGEAEYTLGTRTLAIAKGLQGLNDFFKYLDDPNIKEDLRMPYPEYLYSIANLRMARFATVIGFEISREEVFPGETPVFIAGRTEVIKDKLLLLERKYLENSKFLRRANMEYKRLLKLQINLN